LLTSQTSRCCGSVGPGSDVASPVGLVVRPDGVDVAELGEVAVGVVLRWGGADRAWRALLDEAGVRHPRLHDARHTAATLLLQQGVPARVVMEILGHSQITLTLGTYSHVVPELAHDAAQRMGSSLWGPVATTLAPLNESEGVLGGKRAGQRVRREGLEPPTRGLRVRCSAS
jgi:hypothetical protein